MDNITIENITVTIFILILVVVYKIYKILSYWYQADIANKRRKEAEDDILDSIARGE
ncbi:MAG: hypothetical protein AAB972_00630 [Patescibacteria group bacterium]